jgi:hypothetical protein
MAGLSLLSSSILAAGGKIVGQKKGVAENQPLRRELGIF